MDIVYATANAVVTLPSGAPVVVRGGTHWSAGDEVVRQQPSLFSADPRYGLSYSSPPREMFYAPGEEIPERSSGEVETATAAPGEQRSVRRPKN